MKTFRINIRYLKGFAIILLLAAKVAVALTPCNAYFEFQTNDSLTFHFEGFIEPDWQSEYYWDFGDGTYGSGKIITHTFSNPVNYSYLVCLTATTFFPGTVDSCTANYCEEIFSIPPPECEAAFIFQELPGNYLAYAFTDSSVGVISSWHWDFGDGSTSAEQNPLHIFPGPGLYEVTLEIYDSTTNCEDTVAELLLIDPGGMDCENWFTYQTNDNVTFEFYGESLPVPANIWIWDFGDGESGYGQNVMHVYNPNIGDSVQVCLTTIISDPASGDSCLAFSCMNILVGSQVGCEALFDFEIVTGQHLNVQFYDMSLGNIMSWNWDFGDGEFSLEQFPVHSFSAPGQYEVCLTVEGYFAGTVCSSIYCADIFLEVPFIADFAFVLDTTGNEPNSFFFSDLSVGEPDSWFWDFGDGNVSTDPDPEHTFESSGSYIVCLKISRSWPGGVNYEDIKCKSVKTPNYYDFGGAVFAGEYPLNNPLHQGDTGVAYLYRKYNGYFYPDDTIIFSDYGYYWFAQKREGQYIIKAELTKSSQHFNSYFSSYFGGSLHWQDAMTFVLSDSGNYAVDIILNDAFDIGVGPGMISGVVSEQNTKIIGRADVQLFDSQLRPVRHSITEENGSFSIGNLPFGSFMLYAEATGYYCKPLYITLNEAMPVAENVEITLSNQYISSVTVDKNSLTELIAAPNPFGDQLNVTLDTRIKGEFLMEIYDITGKSQMSSIIFCPEGRTQVLMHTTNLRRGNYILTVTASDGIRYFEKKIIKN